MGDTSNSNGVRWNEKLNEYKDNYENYLKKSIKGEKDEILKEKIENLNSDLEKMVEDLDIENDDLIKEIEEKRKAIKKATVNCDQKKVERDIKINHNKDVNISLTKKLKNIGDEEEDTVNTIFFLKCGVLFFIVCIVIVLYFILK